MRLKSFHINPSRIFVIIFGKRNQRNSYISLAAIVAQKLIIFVCLYIIFNRPHLYLGMTITLFEKMIKYF